MDIFHVVADGIGWKLHAQGKEQNLLNAPTKAQVLQQLPDYMASRTGTVKIHTETGPIEDERTYLRSADPRRSKIVLTNFP